MAEETQAPAATTVETSPMAEEATVYLEEPAPSSLTDALKEEEEATEAAAAAPSEETEIAPSALDHKRKLEDLEGGDEKSKGEADLETGEKKDETEAEISEPADVANAKRQRVEDGGVDGLDGGRDVQKEGGPPVVNGQVPYTKKVESGPIDETVQNSTEDISQQDNLPSEGQQDASRKIEVPNNKVGVLIGKAGETIRSLQTNSGARIQITRDAETDPNSSTRPVELTGTLESINKAEQLIKDVISEADAGGSPALVARGFGATHSGSEVHEMQVPNEKVGLIIGKGGETIKSLQTKSQSRIQLIPQHLPEGDFSKERTVRITGNKKQTEAAKSMIKDVMNQPPGRPSNLSAGHTQGYRPRGPATQPPWGPRGPSPVQSQMQPGSGYDYLQRGTYPPQTTQYPQQSFGSSYPQQPPPRNNLGAGWEQMAAVPVQTPGGYDYYGQGQAMGMGTQPPNPASAPTSALVNYNYGQPQAAGFAQSNPHSQSGPPHQGYGHGYNEPKYGNQAPAQQMYGQQQQSVSSQPGFYPQQGSTTSQTGYAQQPPYNKPATYAGGPQSYGVPRATQPGDQMYQGPVPSTYGSSGPTQQSYPYGSSAPSPQPGPAYGQNYGPAAGVADGYNQAPPAGYSQPNSQVAPGYGQGGQPGPAYAQPGGQSGGYGQYPQGQPGYGEQSVPNVNYGYQGASGDAGYGNSALNSVYGQAPAVGTQAGYGQTGGYDQSMAPPAGYGSHPGSAPVGYAKGVSPQPGGNAGQYDSVPMYGHH